MKRIMKAEFKVSDKPNIVLNKVERNLEKNESIYINSLLEETDLNQRELRIKA